MTYIERLRKDAEQQQIKFISAPSTQSVVRTDDVMALINEHNELDRNHLNAVLEVERLNSLLEDAMNVLRGVISSPGYTDLAQIDRDAVRAFMTKVNR